MSTEVTHEAPPRKEKALTIGAVSKQLEREFPDISISKIRYLETRSCWVPADAGRIQDLHPDDLQRRHDPPAAAREFMPKGHRRSGGGAARTPRSRRASRGPRALRRATLDVRGNTRVPPRGPDETGPTGLVKELEESGVIRGETRTRDVYDDQTARSSPAVTS